MTQNEIISELKKRFCTREEISVWLNCHDRSARRFIENIKSEFPVIHSSRIKGYKIATTKEDLKLVEESIKDNRSKAIAIFEGSKQLNNFVAMYGSEYQQLSLKF